MAAHLYGDLPESKNKDLDNEGKGAAAWSDIAKAPPPPPEVKKEVQETPKVELPPRVTRLAPPPSVLKKQSRVATTTLSTETQINVRESENVKYGYSLFGEIEDEYDPAKPNEYEAVIEERERKRRDAEVEAEKQELLLQQQMELQVQQEKERMDKKRVVEGNEGEEGRKSRRRGSPKDNDFDKLPDPPQTGEGKGMTLAQKMLEKFGWREGEGLGKERQGIATPLIAQKTDNRSAVIVKAQQIPKPQAIDAAIPQVQVPPLKGKPTRVVLLRNLVGPGEVDDDLEDEVALELQKYGEVQRVLIFEVTESNFPAEEAVRIFGEFNTPEASKDAATALNGRFFGGRIVRAGYYSEAKFKECDLAPVAGEFT